MEHRFKLGRHPRRFGNLYHYGQLRAMLRSAGTPLPALLPEVDNAANLPTDLGVMLNATLGDCTSAAPGHIIQMTSADAQGAMITPPDSCVERFYEETGHYVPGDASTDNGANMQDVMAWLTATGYPLGDGSRHKPLSPPIEIDVRQITDVCEAIQEFGFVDIGFNVMSEFMEIGPPDLWDADPRYQTLEGGHCVAVSGYKWSDDRKSVTFNIISWGSRQWRMTQAFWEKFVDECYTWVDPLWIEKTGKTPMGLTEAQLESIRAIGSPISSVSTRIDYGAIEAARHGVARSPHWATVEREFKVNYPGCLAGGRGPIQVHHVNPFHYVVALGRPDLELDERNLVGLTEGPDEAVDGEYHLLLGHRGNFKLGNLLVREDAVGRFHGVACSDIQGDAYWRTEPTLKALDEMSDDEKREFRARLDAELPPDPAVLARFGLTVVPYPP